MPSDAFTQFRARNRYVLLFVFTTLFVILLRTLVHGAGLPEAIFEGLCGGVAASVVTHWWARRSATRKLE